MWILSKKTVKSCVEAKKKQCTKNKNNLNSLAPVIHE